jgi:hypothetical protein
MVGEIPDRVSVISNLFNIIYFQIAIEAYHSKGVIIHFG